MRRYLFICLLLIAGTLLLDEPIQYARLGRGTGRVYSRGTGVATPPPAGSLITINGDNLTINGETIDAH